MLAARLKVAQPLVSQWLSGVTRPGPVARAALEVICGIPAADWLDAHERIEIEQMRTAV